MVHPGCGGCVQTRRRWVPHERAWSREILAAPCLQRMAQLWVSIGGGHKWGILAMLVTTAAQAGHRAAGTSPTHSDPPRLTPWGRGVQPGMRQPGQTRQMSLAQRKGIGRNAQNVVLALRRERGPREEGVCGVWSSCTTGQHHRHSSAYSCEVKSSLQCSRLLPPAQGLPCSTRSPQWLGQSRFMFLSAQPRPAGPHGCFLIPLCRTWAAGDHGTLLLGLPGLSDSAAVLVHC